MSHSQETLSPPEPVLTTELVAEHGLPEETPYPEQESNAVAVLLAEDFRRIGIQPRETRSAVIRRAASRTSKSLARRQLSAPSRATEEQLSQVATSTYRLLDPRQRLDDNDRAHVGRIRPGTLLNIERFGFAGSVTTGTVVSETSDDAPKRTPRLRSKRRETFAPAQSFADGKKTAVSPVSILEIDGQFGLDARPTTRTRIAWIRNSLHQPPFLVALIVVMLLTAAALWMGISFPSPNS